MGTTDDAGERQPGRGLAWSRGERFGFVEDAGEFDLDDLIEADDAQRRERAKTTRGAGWKPAVDLNGRSARRSIRSRQRMRSWWESNRSVPVLAKRKRNLSPGIGPGPKCRVRNASAECRENRLGSPLLHSALSTHTQHSGQPLQALPSAGRVGRRPAFRCPGIKRRGHDGGFGYPRRLNPFAGRLEPRIRPGSGPTSRGLVPPDSGCAPGSVGRLGEDTA